MIAFWFRFAHLRRPLSIVIASITLLCATEPGIAQLSPIAGDSVDLVVVFKEDRVLQLQRGGQVVRTFDIALGAEPEGHKLYEGDNRTPEGVYTIDWRNPNSQFYRSLHISYPHEDDQAAAHRRGVSPGGLIMIHGLPNGRRAREMDHPTNDWTNGCLAVTNEEMDEIWSLVEDGTTIIIYP